VGRIVAFVLLTLTGVAAAQQPPPPTWYPPPQQVYPPPVYRQPVYQQPVYQQPVYVIAYPSRVDYARKSYILRAICIPLLAVGIPVAVAGGIVSIVGGACDAKDRCSGDVLLTGLTLLAAGVAVFVPGAILLGIGNYYRWAARFAERAGFGLAFAPNGAAASLSVRF
jgi:hypothetical protein